MLCFSHFLYPNPVYGKKYFERNNTMVTLFSGNKAIDRNTVGLKNEASYAEADRSRSFSLTAGTPA